MIVACSEHSDAECHYTESPFPFITQMLKFLTQTRTTQ
jgi:hypothetical protein